MDKLLKKFLCCSCVSLLYAGVLSAPAYGQSGEIFIVEQGADPTAFGGGPSVVDVTGRLGEQISFDVFMSSVGPDPLEPVRGYAADFPCVAEGGISGSVEYVQGTGLINSFRDDFIFFQILGVALGADESTCPAGGNPQPDGTVRFAGGLPAGQDRDFTGAGPQYLGEFAMSVSADACGTFRVPLIGGSGLANIDSQTIPAFLRDLLIAAAPLNDACDTAISAGAGGTFAYNTNCAATDGPAGCPADSDIWYSFTTNCAGILSAESPGAQIAIYSGSTCTPTDAEQVGCASGRVEVLPVGLGEDFLIRLGSVGGGAITGDITIACSPFCDTDADCTDQTDACNIGRCNPATGCFQEPANEGGSCDDGVFCTINDACSSGACVGDDNAGVGPCDDRNGCTIDSCPDGAASADECINASVNDTACVDGDDQDPCVLAGGVCTAGVCGGCVSFLRPDLALDVVGGTPSGCAAVGDDGIITVEVNLGDFDGLHPERFPAAPLASGAQIFLSYDNTALDFVDILPGGGVFVFQLFKNVDEEAGTIDYAVGVSPSAPAATGTGTVAVLQFRVLDPDACSAGGVSFREHNPPTRLGATDGTELIPRRQKIDCVLDDDCVNPIGVRASCFGGFCTFEEDFDAATGTFFEPLNAKDIGIDDGPPVLNCPFEGVVQVPADCNTRTATVTWDTIVGTDNCDGEIECLDANGNGLGNGGEFAQGSTAFECTATDSCGNSSSCSFTIENTGSQSVAVDVQVSPTVADPTDRCFTFEVSECGEAGGGNTEVIEQTITLGSPDSLRGHGTTTLVVEPGNWECISVRDVQHTLASTCLLECGDDGIFHASFKGAPEFTESCHWLINGNLNSDAVIDVLDYVIWSGGVRSQASCDPFDLDADISGDGVVTSADFSFILINFLENDKAGCDEACSGGVGARAPGLTEISVRELYNMGFTAEQIRRADVTGDGMVDMQDMAAYVNGDAPQTRKRATSTRGQVGRR